MWIIVLSAFSLWKCMRPGLIITVLHYSTGTSLLIEQLLYNLCSWLWLVSQAGWIIKLVYNLEQGSSTNNCLVVYLLCSLFLLL